MRRAALALVTSTILVLAGAAPDQALGQAGAELEADLAARFADAAQRFKADLVQLVLPYWYDTVDWERGGYLLSDDGTEAPPPAADKRLVTQARMVWAFAHAHRKGLRDPARDYLAAAETGYRFLLEHLYDPIYGGFFWATDLVGVPLDDEKLLYGQAFALYALVEYHRASGAPAALQHAVDLFRTVQREVRDQRHGGWREVFTRDWRANLGNPGLKSANAHLHWMEALEELLGAVRAIDPDRRPIKARKIREALAEALRVNGKYFFPRDPGMTVNYRTRDWGLVADPGQEISYGHNVEFGWLMIRTQLRLRRAPDWTRFDALLDHALAHGFDHERGGLCALGSGDEPAHDTRKVWWVQAELLAALSDRLAQGYRADHAAALDRLLTFLETYQIDPSDGIWFDTVSAAGDPVRRHKAHGWKAAYHDVRALLKFIKAFGAMDAAASEAAATPTGGR